MTQLAATAMTFPGYEELMAQCLAALPDQLDKREGSLIYTALGPACLRLAEAYVTLGDYYDLLFADTAAGSYLDRLAGQYGIVRKPAGAALRKGTFLSQSGKPFTLPVGMRFYLDGLFFVVEELLEEGAASLRCETPGEAGNAVTGALLPADYLQDFGSATLTGVLIPGEEQETDESLRQRLRQRLAAPAFGGNIADYQENVRAISGVGAVRVQPVVNGGGTVGLVLLDSRFLPAEETVLSLVREEICPEPGKGLGLAPIGHTVTVEPAAAVTVAISATLVTQGITDELARERVLAVLEGYLLSLRQDWENTPVELRISALTSRILTAQGITDVRNITINGKAENLLLDEDAVPVLDPEQCVLTVGS